MPTQDGATNCVRYPQACGEAATLTGGSGRDSFVFGKSFGDDVVTDFDKSFDRLVLLDGAAVASTTVLDANGDGTMDLRIGFTTGGSLTLWGIDSLAGVEIESTGASAWGSGDVARVMWVADELML